MPIVCGTSHITLIECKEHRVALVELNVPARELKTRKHEERRIAMRQILQQENANYTVEGSLLARGLLATMPDVANSVIEKLKAVYESLDSRDARNQFRRAYNIDSAFTWSETPEGNSYWGRINDRSREWFHRNRPQW